MAGDVIKVNVTEAVTEVTVNVVGEGSLGYIPEDVDNKVTAFQGTPDDEHYPSEKLVKDNLDLKQNTIDDYADLPIKNVLKVHRASPYTTPSINTWHDVVWDTLSTDTSTSGFTYSGAQVTCNVNGIVNVAGCVRPIWNGSEYQWDPVLIYARGIVSYDEGITWEEQRCLQTVGMRMRQVGTTTTLHYNGSFLCTSGTLFKIQYRTDTIGLDLEGSSVFDNPVSASLHLEYSTRGV